MRDSVRRRIRVMVVRRRLEETAASLVEAAIGTRPGSHSVVARRLMLLPAHAPDDRWSDLCGLARRASRVYELTSAVLHSNRAFGDVSEHLVQEWEQTAAEAADAVQDRTRRELTHAPSPRSSAR